MWGGGGWRSPGTISYPPAPPQSQHLHPHLPRTTGAGGRGGGRGAKVHEGARPERRPGPGDPRPESSPRAQDAPGRAGEIAPRAHNAPSSTLPASAAARDPGWQGGTRRGRTAPSPPPQAYLRPCGLRPGAPGARGVRRRRRAGGCAAPRLRTFPPPGRALGAASAPVRRRAAFHRGQRQGGRGARGQRGAGCPQRARGGRSCSPGAGAGPLAGPLGGEDPRVPSDAHWARGV